MIDFNSPLIHFAAFKQDTKREGRHTPAISQQSAPQKALFSTKV